MILPKFLQAPHSLHWTRGRRLTNLTGHPFVVVPNGFSDSGTLTSITFSGRIFDKGLLIAFAKFYQDATNFHNLHPPMFLESETPAE
ncbi:MAG: hypothetical protein R6W68_06430 [Ignavibacteriaceae bacterium]